MKPVLASGGDQVFNLRLDLRCCHPRAVFSQQRSLYLETAVFFKEFLLVSGKRFVPKNRTLLQFLYQYFDVLLARDPRPWGRALLLFLSRWHRDFWLLTTMPASDEWIGEGVVTSCSDRTLVLCRQHGAAFSNSSVYMHFIAVQMQ